MVRFATKEDIPFLKHAWKVCFDDPDAFIQWNFRENFSCEDTLIAMVDGQPASNLQLMPHRVVLRGVAYDINYVSGVATLPEFRHRGLVRELFGAAFLEMKRRKQAFSLLVPFNYEFYEKFGYRKCYKKTSSTTAVLPAYDVMWDTPSVELAEKLDAIYQKEMEQKNGYALRSGEAWRRILEDLLLLSKGRALFCEKDGSLVGYALVTPKTEGGWEIQELCGEMPVDSVMQEEKPFAMARILDPVAILSNMAKTFSGDVRIRLRDDCLAENNRVIRIAHGKVEACTEYEIDLDIRELAPLIFGFGEDITGTGLFSTQNPYLNLIF